MKRKTAETRLRCTRCFAEVPIYRTVGRMKKAGHIKHLWCYRCEDRTPHIEFRPQEYTDEEMERKLMEQAKEVIEE